MITTEDEIKTWYHCTNLYRLGGNILQFDNSQLLLFNTIKDLYLLIIKDKLKDFDKDLFYLIQINLHKLYRDLSTVDDAQYLTNYTISLIYKYFQKFPISTYTPVLVNYEPELYFKNKKFSLKYDIILRQNNKSGFIHAISFVFDLNSHFKSNDLFIYPKLKFLKNLSSKKRGTHPLTRMHFISVKPASFRNKNQRSYRLSTYMQTERDLCEEKLNRFYQMFEYFIKNNETHLIKPFCMETTCQKRKECFYDN